MKFDAGTFSFLLALSGAISGWIAWWIGRRQQIIQKAVKDAEQALNERRDFNNLVNNQLDISKNIAHGFEDLEDQINALSNEVREIKAYLIGNQKYS